MDAHPSGADVVDEYAESIVKKGDSLFYKYGSELRPVTVETIAVPYRTAKGMQTKSFTVYRTFHGPDRSRRERQVDQRAPDERAGEGAHAVVRAHEVDELQVVSRDNGVAHEFVEQHDLRRCGWRHCLLSRELRSDSRYAFRLAQAG